MILEKLVLLLQAFLLCSVGVWFFRSVVFRSKKPTRYFIITRSSFVGAPDTFVRNNSEVITDKLDIQKFRDSLKPLIEKDYNKQVDSIHIDNIINLGEV